MKPGGRSQPKAGGAVPAEGAAREPAGWRRCRSLRNPERASVSERALGSGWGANKPDSRNGQGPDLVPRVGPSEAFT